MSLPWCSKLVFQVSIPNVNLPSKSNAVGYISIIVWWLFSLAPLRSRFAPPGPREASQNQRFTLTFTLHHILKRKLHASKCSFFNVTYSPNYDLSNVLSSPWGRPFLFLLRHSRRVTFFFPMLRSTMAFSNYRRINQRLGRCAHSKSCQCYTYLCNCCAWAAPRSPRCKWWVRYKQLLLETVVTFVVVFLV